MRVSMGFQVEKSENIPDLSVCPIRIGGLTVVNGEILPRDTWAPYN